MSAKESQEASLVVQYFEHLKLVDEWEVSVVPMKAYDPFLALPWFMARNPGIDRSTGRLRFLPTRNGSQQAKNREEDHSTPLPERGEENTNDVPPLDIQFLKPTAFGHHIAIEVMVEGCAIRLGEWESFLGLASLNGITEG